MTTNESSKDEPTPSPNYVKLLKRQSEDDYWAGYLAALKATRDGVQKSIEGFELLRKQVEHEVEHNPSDN
jgi:hypothetical protein